MTGIVAYCAITGVACAAYFGVGWPVLLAGASILTLISILEQRRYQPRLAAIGMTEMLYTTGMASFAQSLLAAVAAYGLGLIVRLVFAG